MDATFGVGVGYPVTEEALQNAADFPGRSANEPTTNPILPSGDFDALPEESI